MKQDGFIITEFKPGDFSLLSLRLGIESYFSTYSSVRDIINGIFPRRKPKADEPEDFRYSSKYLVAFFETIIHFQHFFELFCKKVLTEEHPLLGLAANEKPEILVKLVKGVNIDSGLIETSKTIEMSETLKRLNVVLSDGSSRTHNTYGFLKSHISLLKELNELRNRILHRGRFVLKYDYLDKFIGGQIFPVIQKIAGLKEINDMKRVWRYKDPVCEIDPLEEISKSILNESYNWKKISILKEIGRASYHNPIQKKPKKRPNQPSWVLSFEDINNEEHVSKAKGRALAMQKSQNAPWMECPVCGVESFSKYYTTEDEIDPETNEITNVISFPYEGECHCCTFQITSDVWNLKDHGYEKLNIFSDET